MSNDHNNGTSFIGNNSQHQTTHIHHNLSICWTKRDVLLHKVDFQMIFPYDDNIFMTTIEAMQFWYYLESFIISCNFIIGKLLVVS